MTEKPLTKSQRTRRRIIDAAAKRFFQKGVSGTSLREIAGDVDMKVGSLYYHFQSKEELANEIMRLGTDGARDAVLDAVKAAGQNAPPLEKLKAAFKAHLRYLLTEGNFSAALVRALYTDPEELRTRHIRKQHAYARIFADLIDEAIAAGEIRRDLDPSLVRMLWLGALNWAIGWYKPGGLTPEEIVDQFMLMIENGVKPARGVGRRTPSPPTVAAD